MIVLHMSLLHGQAFIWGEHSVSKPNRRGRPADERIPRSPYDLDAVTLVKTITRATGITLHFAKGVDLLAWLPSQGGLPLPSKLIAGTAPHDGDEIKIEPWMITTIPLYSDNVVELLAACRGRSILEPGVVIGSDLTFLAQVLELAAGMVTHGQILPSIRRSPLIGHYAVWEPLFLAAADQNRHQLAQEMPDVCRCIGNDPQTHPSAPALSVVTEWVTHLMDGLVRMGAQAAGMPQLSGRIMGNRRVATVHDVWLTLLATPLPFFQSTKEKEPVLDELMSDVHEWHRKVTRLASSPFRLCFQLKEPVADNHDDGDTGLDAQAKAVDKPWLVSFLLQAKDDPSLLLPVAEIWQGSAQIKKLFASVGVSAPELLLASLGQAASLCPQVEESLRGRTPTGFDLTTDQAYHFLQNTAPLLAQAGFGVMLPNWWKGRSRQRLTARGRVSSPPMSAGGMLSLDHLVQVDWQVALGNDVLAMDELKALAELKAPLVNLRGQWVEVNPLEIQTMLKQWQKKRPKRLTTRDLVRLSLGSGDSPVGLPLAGIEANGWIGDLLDQLDGKVPFSMEPVPSGLKAALRPYQERGFSWLSFLRRWGLGACLADDMGLGKTIQTLTLLLQQHQAGEKRPVLLICPTSLVGNWQRESHRFTPDLSVITHHGQSRPKGEAFLAAANSSQLVITSYALLGRDLAQFQAVDWAGVILDEAQNIKNPSTKQAQAARSITADYRIALTGTPVENNVGDLWSLMEFLNPGLLGNQADFKRDFFIPIQIERNTDAMAKLHQLTGPFILRRLKTDKSIIQDLPDKIENKVFCPL
ncbi:MAG: DEAD/DEAH box helicase, partial [Bacillota bacterium]